jgi:hypothetical protein
MLVYTLVKHQPIPKKYAIGSSITFGVIISMWLRCCGISYCRRMFGRGAEDVEKSSASGSQRSEGSDRQANSTQVGVGEEDSVKMSGGAGENVRERKGVGRNWPNSGKNRVLGLILASMKEDHLRLRGSEGGMQKIGH